MPIPDYQTLMLLLLKLASDGEERKFREAIEALATEFELSGDERAELLPSGSQPVFDNRVGWAKTYLKQAGLLASPKRGIFHITQPGMDLLARKPTFVGLETLDKYEEFRAFRSRRRTGSSEANESQEPAQLKRLQQHQHRKTNSPQPISACDTILRPNS